MRRLSSLMLSVALVPTVVIAGPVVSRPAPAPEPVPASVQEVAVEPVLTTASTAPTPDAPRTVAAIGRRTTAPFEAFGVTWAQDRQAGEVAVQVRTRTGGRWTDWVELDEETPQSGGLPTDTGPGARAGTEPKWVGPSDGVQVRVSSLSGRGPRDVKVALIDPGNGPADAATGPTLGSSVATAATPRPTIRSRADWGADESIRRGSPSYAGTLSAVTLHHSASSNDYAPADVPAIMRSFYAFHVQSRGWSDIGYNILVDKYGNAWEGRAGGLDRPVIGAHAGGFNTGTAGVSMIGTYDTVTPPPVLVETVARVAAWKLSLHDRDPKGSVTLTSAGSTRYPAGTAVTLPRIFAHRDVSSTACPGAQGVAALPQIRDRAAALVAAGGAPTPPPPPADPFGALEQASPDGSGVRVVGWAIDADAPTFTRVDITVDGRVAGTLVADVNRPDVAAANPPYSAFHGFDGVVPATAGSREVCAVGLNQASGTNRSLGCRTVTVGSAPPPPPPPPAEPVGALDGVTPETSAVRVRGWAVDPDAADFTRIAVTVDGAPAATVVADVDNPYVRTAFPQYSSRHGFDARVTATPGVRTVCATAVNQGAGHDVALGCRTVTVAAPPPPPPPPPPPTSPSVVVPRATNDSCPEGKVPTQTAFTDIGTSTHAATIRCMVWWQVASGRTPTTFAPTQPVTRAQMASFLAKTVLRSGGWLPPSPSNAFRDDDATGIHHLAINQLAAVGIVKGKAPGVFDPNGLVTREQMATFLMATYEKRTGRAYQPLAQEDYFTDDEGSLHESSINRMTSAGFAGGVATGGFAPRLTTDRGQTATFLARMLDLLVEAGDTPDPS